MWGCAWCACGNTGDLQDRGDKLEQVVIHRRLSFETAFAYANERLAGCIVAVMNADVFFADGALEKVTWQPSVLHNTVRSRRLLLFVVVAVRSRQSC